MILASLFSIQTKVRAIGTDMSEHFWQYLTAIIKNIMLYFVHNLIFATLFLGLSSQTFLAKLLCAVPSHWIILYDSNDMGLGTNRFLHHVLNYKGPTLILLKVEDDQIFCIASPNEWKESNHYWGGEDSAVIQILPKFDIFSHNEYYFL